MESTQLSAKPRKNERVEYTGGRERACDDSHQNIIYLYLLAFKLKRHEGFKAVESIQFQCKPGRHIHILRWWWWLSLGLLILLLLHGTSTIICHHQQLRRILHVRVTLPGSRNKKSPHFLPQHFCRERTEHRIHGCNKARARQTTFC